MKPRANLLGVLVCCFQTVTILCNTVGDDPFSTCVKYSEKIFYVRVRIVSRLEVLVFRNILRT